MRRLTPGVPRTVALPEFRNQRKFGYPNYLSDVDRAPRGPGLGLRCNVSCQNTWYTQTPPACGVMQPSGSVVTIAGRYFLQSGSSGITFDQFVSKSQADVEDSLRNDYLVDFPEIPSGTTAFILMDIEGPVPMGVYQFSEPHLTNVITAFKRRYAACRAVFPNAKLCAYQFPKPAENGDGTRDSFRDGFSAMTGVMVEQGMFDQNVDYLVPILYHRYGPTDDWWGTAEAMTRLALSASFHIKSLVTSASLGIFPLLTYYIFNTQGAVFGSNHDQEHILDLAQYGINDPIGTLLGMQMEVMTEYAITDFVFWIGADQTPLIRPSPNNWTLDDYICSTGFGLL